MRNKNGANVPVITLIILLVFLVIVFLSFTFYNYQSQSTKTATTKTKSNTIKDCATNMDCFIDSARSCQKAKTISTTNIDLFGIEQTTTSYFEIKGIQSDKCLFYLRTEDIKLQLSDELIQQMQNDRASEAEINQQLIDSQDLANQLKGRYGTCKIETQKLITLLTDWEQGKFSTEDLKNEDCSGPYFSQEL